MRATRTEVGGEDPDPVFVVKQAIPRADAAAAPGSVEELRTANAALRKENRELARANDILQAAASFFGAELDRQSKR